MKYRLAFLLALITGCSRMEKNNPEHSFYYWKTTFKSDSGTAAFINKENIQHFYIHFFDVDWDDNLYMPAPVAEIQDFKNAAPFIQSLITPVIFITNRCLERMDNAWCDSLAVKISNKIAFISNRLNEINAQAKKSIDEIQIDCDWTASTKEKYFHFLQLFKQYNSDKIISATIRLYPYKYFEKTGVPPVDRGLLMCYNLTNIKEANNSNSIFNINDLKQYLRGSKKYPLPLDVALPVFEWYAWFRKGSFMGIIYPGENGSFIENPILFKRTGNNFTLNSDTTIMDNYLTEGDVLRQETPDKEELGESAKLLLEKFSGLDRIAFFYWDSNLINKNKDVIHSIYTAF